MAAYLLPALEAFARFMPDLPRGHAVARMHHAAPYEAPVALVIEGYAVSEATGIVKTIDLTRDVAASVPEGTVPAAIFVTGDVVAPNAVLEEYDTDWSPTLKVLGSVTVRSAFLYGSASEIDGDPVASDAVFGFYNHGSLRVGGAVRATMLLDSDYTWQVAGPVACPYVLGDLFRASFKRSHPSKDLTKILVWDAVTDDNDLNSGFIWEALSRGESILRPADVIGTKPKPQLSAVARKRLATLTADLDAGQAVTDIDLSDCQLRFVPEDLRRFTDLRRLSLKDNKIGKLPSWLTALAGLESLDLRGCGLRQVPSDLDRLPALRALHLSENDIKKGPERSGPLVRLEYLTIGSPYCFSKQAPAVHGFTANLDLAAFPRLRVVEQIFGGVGLHYSSAHRYWGTPTLESLRIDAQIPLTLPEHLAEATGLRVLSVNLDGDGVAASAAVLSRMPNLKLLNLDLFSQLTREQFDLLCAAVPNAFVRHWCATPTLTPED